MQQPLQITTHNLSLSDVAEERIRSRAEKLERSCDQTISCSINHPCL